MTAIDVPLVGGEPDSLGYLLKLCGGDIDILLEVIRAWRRQASRRDRLRMSKDEIAARLIGDPVLLKRLLDKARAE